MAVPHGLFAMYLLWLRGERNDILLCCTLLAGAEVTVAVTYLVLNAGFYFVGSRTKQLLFCNLCLGVKTKLCSTIATFHLMKQKYFFIGRIFFFLV